MHRFFKYSLVIFIAIVLTIGFAISVLALYDPNAYKPLITQWVKAEKQRELRLDGDIKLTFYPRLSINLSHLSLSEFDSHEEFATIDNLYLSLSLWPLLSQRLVVDKFAMRGFKATLIRYTDGRTNIDDLIPSDDASTFEFDLNHLLIEDTALTLHDEKGVRDYTLSDLSLSTEKITQTSLNYLKLLSKGTTTNLRNNDIAHFEVQLDIANLQMDIDYFTGDKVSLITQVTRLEDRINGSFTWSNITNTSGQFKSDMMIIELATEKNTHIVHALLNSPLSGNLNTQEWNLPNVEFNLRIFQPQSPNQLIHSNLQGAMSFANKPTGHMRANLSGNLDDSLINAKLNLTNFTNPTIGFDIDIDQLNIDRYQSQFERKQLQKKDNKSSTPLNQSLDLSSLTDLNANGNVRIQSFQTNDISISGFAFEIQSGDAQLTTDPEP